MVGGVAEEVTGTVCEVPAIDLLHLLQPLAPGLGESCELVTGRVGHACSLVVAGRPRPAPSRWLARRARGTSTSSWSARSEERRGGTEGVSTCRSRWSPYH